MCGKSHDEVLKPAVQPSPSLLKNFFRSFGQGAGNCVIIQGFADRSEVEAERVEVSERLLAEVLEVVDR